MNEEQLIEMYNEGERKFSSINLPGVDLEDADLRGIDLGNAELPGAILRFTNLSEANLSYANLRGADFTGANLQGANLSGANLREVIMNPTDLSDANLSYANLRDADLTDSYMTNANLDEAIVGSTALPETVDEDQLVMAKMLSIYPGQTYEDAMKNLVDRTFMEDGLPGFDEGFEMGLDDLSYMLESYGVNLHDAEGQGIIQHYIDHAVDGWYGDFYRFAYCSGCEKEFRPDYNLEYVDQVWAGRILCPECAS
ncbi:MAG: pentapeptide repeat-containing protein [Anaerolineales bacterium]|jgi:hypothetical protein